MDSRSRLKNLPVNTQITVTEQNVEGYQTSYTVNEKQQATGKLTLVEDSMVDVVNEKSDIAATGITDSMGGIGAGLRNCGNCCIIFWRFSSSAFEKRKEEMKQEKEKEISIKEDLLFLVLKILIFIALLAVTFLFIFGICRISDNMMSPAFKDGDLAVYYRLQKEFQPSDTVVLEKTEKFRYEGFLQLQEMKSI